MGSSKAPEAPDYVQAAKAQGQENLKAAIATGRINNPNVYNPYGTQTVTWNNDIPTITQTLSDDQQAILRRDNWSKQFAGDASVDSAKLLRGNLGKNLDFSGLPNAPQSAMQRRDDVINSMMSRIDSDTAGQRNSKNSELIAAGIRPGTEAYKAAMTQIDRQYNDARNNAILAGGQEATRDFGMDQATRQQAISEMLQQRQVPLNEYTALMTGQQVNSPFAGGLGYQAGAGVGAAPMFNAISNQGQAQQNIYNQNQAQMNSNITAGAGLIGALGAAAIGAPSK